MTGSPEHQGFDEAAGVIRNGAWRAGMPLGGIGCGKFELLPSCWFARFAWNHNWDLPSWTEPFVPSRGTFFALSVHDGPRRVTRWLRRGWPEEELAGAEQVRLVEFRALWPVAEVAFTDPKLPVQASLRAWSPLVPHNIKDSSLPVAFFELTVENPTDRRMEVSALMSLENYMGIGGVWVHDGKQKWYFADRSRAQLALVGGSVLQGLRFNTPHQFAGIGQNVAGEYLLLSDGPTTDRGWDALSNGKELVDDFLPDGELSGLQMASREDKTRSAGALCRKFTLGPHDKQIVHFLLVWWMPSHVTLDLKDHGHFHAGNFRDSEKLAAYAFAERERLARETTEWQRFVRDSNLPAWAQRLTINSMAALFNNSILTRDGGFAMQENPGRAEGALGGLERRGASGALLRAFFPELDRRELELFRACQQESGEAARLCGNVYRGFPNTNAWRAVSGEADATRAFISEAQRHARATGDRKFGDDFAPSLARAEAWLKQINATLVPPHAAFAGGNLAAARRAHDHVYRYHKSPWLLPADIPLSPDSPPANSESHRNGVAPWALLAELTGADLDVTRGRLILAPQLSATMTELHAPVFLPAFWAKLDYGPQQFRLGVVKHFGEPVELREVAAGAEGKAIALPKPFRAEAGAVLDLSAWREPLRAKPPASVKAGAELSWSRSGIGTLLWSATASSEEPFATADAFDGYRETRWQTVAPARTSDWFKLDLGEARQLRRLEVLMTQRIALSVQGSRDGATWQMLATLESDATRRAWWAIDLPTAPLRFLKLAPAADCNEPWRIYEVRVE
ncbi:MAG: discoidin domain-containing protein [Verrucomicrobia bacterium]|nr:discoidin domain-containing protein [Verrucomicrobiota bacterium]